MQQVTSYRDEWSGRFAKRPPPEQPKPRTWHRAAVRLPALFKPRGPWRETRDEAVQDAVAAGLGHYDRREREYILPVPAEIQSTNSIDRPAD